MGLLIWLRDGPTRIKPRRKLDFMFLGYNFRPNFFQGGEPAQFPGKTAHGPASGGMTRIRVLHREVEPTVPVVSIRGEKTSPLLNQRDEKIDRSAEALRVRHHPFLFPSEQSTL